jgi:hypothetical protein
MVRQMVPRMARQMVRPSIPTMKFCEICLRRKLVTSKLLHAWFGINLVFMPSTLIGYGEVIPAVPNSILKHHIQSQFSWNYPVSHGGRNYPTLTYSMNFADGLLASLQPSFKLYFHDPIANWSYLWGQKEICLSP